MKNSSRDGRLITLQYCSCFCHTLTWISHGCTCISHPNPPSHLPLYPIPLGRYSFVGMLLRVQNVSVCCGQVKESNSQLGKKKREMGIPDHLTCLLWNHVLVKKQQLEPDMEQWTGSKLGKQYVKVVYCHPVYLTYIQSASCKMLGWMKPKIAGRNINNLRYADDTILMAESQEELKRLLVKVKEESEKPGLKLNIQKTKTVTSGPKTSWQIDGETVETVADFIFLCSKITADGDCSHEIKRWLLLGRKTITKLDSVLKSKGISLPTKVHLVKAMVFPVVMDGCESWTIKKLNSEELMLLNCGVGEDSWESFGLQGDPTNPS